MAHELDRQLGERLADGGVAERAELDLALDRVARTMFEVDVARMAAELGRAFTDLAVEHPLQARDADLLGVRLAAPAPVELREVVNPAVLAKRQAGLPRQLEEVREQPRIPVPVVMHVEMARRAAHQLVEARELAPERCGPAVLDRVHVEVQAHAERGRGACQPGRLLAPGGIDHQARAAQDPVPMGFEDAAVDPPARAEVVAVHDQALHRTAGRTGPSASSQRSASASRSTAHAAGFSSSSSAAQSRELTMRAVSAVSKSAFSVSRSGTAQSSLRAASA